MNTNLDKVIKALAIHNNITLLSEYLKLGVITPKQFIHYTKGYLPNEVQIALDGECE